MGESEVNWLTEQARQLLEARYFLRDRAGKVAEALDGLARRVAASLAGVEEQYGGVGTVDDARKLFHRLMITRRLLFSSPILMNAGTPTPFLAACYVVPIQDSLVFPSAICGRPASPWLGRTGSHPARSRSSACSTQPPRPSSRVVAGGAPTWRCSASIIRTSSSSPR